MNCEVDPIGPGVSGNFMLSILFRMHGLNVYATQLPRFVRDFPTNIGQWRRHVSEIIFAVRMC